MFREDQVLWGNLGGVRFMFGSILPLLLLEGRRQEARPPYEEDVGLVSLGG